MTMTDAILVKRVAPWGPDQSARPRSMFRSVPRADHIVDPNDMIQVAGGPEASWWGLRLDQPMSGRP